MNKTAKFARRKPRRIGETIYTDSGSRLASVRQFRDSGWFAPLMATLPIGVFVLAYFW